MCSIVTFLVHHSKKRRLHSSLYAKHQPGERKKRQQQYISSMCGVKGSLFLFFINARMRTNHDHKRRFDRLDLHPFVRSFARHLVCRDKTIKLNFQIEKYCVAVKANVFPKRPSNRVMRKKTTTSCYIIYYDYSHIVKYVIIVKREGKKWSVLSE